MSRFALATLAAALGLGLGLTADAPAADAQPAARPGPPAGRPFVPPPIEVTSVNGPLARHVQRQAAGLASCARGERRAPVAARARVRWNRDGKVTAVSVAGGSPRFNRCAAGILRGWVADVTGRGAAIARFVVDRPPAPPLPPDDPLGPTPVPTPVPPPVTISTGPLEACTVDTDCTVYFRTHACFPGDPIAVNAGKLDLARRTYPPKHDACAMGGPQYERMRMANEGRWSATCEARRCVLHDAGLRRDPLDPLR